MRHAWLCCIAAMLFSVALFAGDGKKMQSVDQKNEETRTTQQVTKAKDIKSVTVRQKVVKAKPVTRDGKIVVKAKKPVKAAPVAKEGSAVSDRSGNQAKKVTKKKPAKRR